MTVPFRRRRARVRPSPVFLALLAAAALGGYLSWTATVDDRTTRLGVFLFILAGWVVTLCLHEFAHALLALLFGDHEVEARGYLTLNPLRYSHPVLSILLPVLFIAMGGIGLPGGAVYLHPQRLRSDLQRALVALAGPAINLGFAVLLIGLAKSAAFPNVHGFFWAAVAGLGLLQLMAAVLNLLPVPGLDGYGIVEPYLDPKFRAGAEQFKPFGLLLVFALLQVRQLNRVFFGFIYGLFDLSGLPHEYADVGIRLLQFWRPN
ncbi:MAG TPA: site-2 protease family protein [Jatrophihabitans sp.]|nr:site-2 protease family protein [Jatrophihabitans sp.]